MNDTTLRMALACLSIIVVSCIAATTLLAYSGKVDPTLVAVGFGNAITTIIGGVVGFMFPRLQHPPEE